MSEQSTSGTERIGDSEIVPRDEQQCVRNQLEDYS